MHTLSRNIKIETASKLLEKIDLIAQTGNKTSILFRIGLLRIIKSHRLEKEPLLDFLFLFPPFFLPLRNLFDKPEES